jgi:hypothetical protein
VTIACALSEKLPRPLALPILCRPRSTEEPGIGEGFPSILKFCGIPASPIV